MCMFICMHCIFCPLSIFTWMSNMNQSEPPCILCLLQACPTQDSIFPVAQSSCSPVFLTHTSNPLASSVGSFFKNPLNSQKLPTLPTLLFQTTTLVWIIKEPQSCLPLMAWTPTVCPLKATRGCLFLA